MPRKITFEHNLAYYFKYIFATLYLTSTYIIGEILGTAGRLGGVILLVLVILTFLMEVINGHGVFKFRLTEFHLYLFLFAIFCLASTLWAQDSSLALDKGINQFELLVFAFILYICFSNDRSIQGLLRVVMWSGYLVSLYILLQNGATTLISMSVSGQRLSSDLLNANTLGMCAAYSIMICIYFILYRKVNILEIIMLPIAAIIVAASGSRKALIIVVGGIVLLLVLWSIRKGKLRSFFWAIFILVVAILAFWLILQIPIFDSIRERMGDLLAAFFQGRSTDRSTAIRIDLTSLGMDLFRQHPVVGLGLDNVRLFTRSVANSNAYAHNNFVEMLADGGIIGFLLYYWLYGVILFRLIRYRNFKDSQYIICLSIFILSVALDYAYVSYYAYSTYFFLLIYYLYSNGLKSNYRIRGATIQKYIKEST